MKDWVPILSLLVALISVFFGPLISARTAKRAMLGPMRQKWINDLRGLLSEISGSCLHYWQTGYEDRTEEEYKRITDLTHQVIFHLNPNEDEHNKLIDVIRRLEGSLSKGKEADDEFFEAYNKLLDQGRKVLKTEWEVVKNA
ncbi:hypothetical protein [Methylomonas rivi]|uniref:Uncharacterized protein n=1 Tax=Methylomonas rivi TaxID=2952226 RepID=A0ABT1U475_9GAMM|nr:hypothetical protein [Methylomonas sp. WSC-6]MCQ8128358.1 hypothetical protein [Methylomonas sp. WSC-6]